MAIGLTDRIRNFTRTRISPRVTRLYERLNFVNRQTLVANLRTTHDPQLFQEFKDRGLIKGRFSQSVNSFDQLEPYMLGPISDRPLEEIDLPYLATPMFLDKEHVLFDAPRLIRGLESTLHINPKVGAAMFLSLGATVAVSVLCGGWGLLALTTAGVLATKYNDQFPASGRYYQLGEALRFFSRTFSPFVYAADVLYLTKMVFDADLNISSVLESFDLEGTIAVVMGTLLLINHFVRKGIDRLNRTYGAQTNAGQIKYMQKLLSGAIYSTASELTYAATRLLLWGAASANLLINTYIARGWTGLIPLAIPFLGLGATAWLRARPDTVYTSKEQARRLDLAKIYTAVGGLGAGLAGAGLFSLFNWSPLDLISYATFYGTSATLFLNEYFNIFHSINTNIGLIKGVLTSSRDVLGEIELKKLNENEWTLVINPHTGTKEHTYGLLFTVLLNTNPNLSFLVMFDRILGSGKWLEDQRMDKDYIKWVQAIQRGIFDLLFDGFNPQFALPDQYRQLINNLKNTAAYFETALPRDLLKTFDAVLDQDDLGQITSKTPAEVYRALQEAGYLSETGKILKPFDEKNPQLKLSLDLLDLNLLNLIFTSALSAKSWFDQMETIAEYRRAAFEKLTDQASDFREAAAQLERQLNRQVNGQPAPALSYGDLYGQLVDGLWEDGKWSKLLKCFDTDLITIIPLARKAVFGDEKMVRKVENVAADMIRLGVTTYKGWRKERPQDKANVEDWICGEWTQVANRNFRRDAAAGTEAASKYLWVRTELLLADVQIDNARYLSTSPVLEAVGNDPAGQAGFVKGTGTAALKVGAREFTTDEYYFVSDPARPLLTPRVTELLFRPGVTGLPRGYRLANYNAVQNPDMEPAVFTFHGDWLSMQDKNDIQFGMQKLIGIVKRDRRNKFIHLMMKEPVSQNFELVDPFPNKKLDFSRGLRGIDGNLELIADNGRFIPFKVDRGAIHEGINDNVVWQSLSEAVITLDARKQILDFTLAYDQFAVKNDQHVNDQVVSVVRQPNGGDLTVTYRTASGQTTTETIKTPPGLGHNRAAENLDFELSGDRKKIILNKTVTVPLPPSLYPRYYKCLDLPAGQTVRLRVNNFTELPRREGDQDWVRVFYTDGTIGFARTPDGINFRPKLFNKDLNIGRGQPS